MKHEIYTEFEPNDTVYHYYETNTGDNPPFDIVPHIVEDKIKRIIVHIENPFILRWYETELGFIKPEMELFYNEDEAMKHFNSTYFPQQNQ